MSMKTRGRRTAEEVANYDNQILEMKADVKLLKWMNGFNLAIGVALLFKAFA